MNKKIFYVVLFLVFAKMIYADWPVVETYYQHGERTTEDIVLDDDDLDYSFNKYYFKVDEDLTKRLSLMFNYVDQSRNYKIKDELNNNVRDYKNSWDYYFLKDKNSSLKLDVNLSYKTKRYDIKEKLDFNRVKASSQLTYRDEGNWWGAVKGGVEDYSFINNSSKDRDIYYGKVTAKKYFYDERLTLIGNVKLKQYDFKTRTDRNEYEAEAGVDIKTDYNLLEKISIRGEVGERNTIEDEEYEEELDFDYMYTLLKAKTVHQLLERLETSVRGEWKEKKYEEVDYDYNGFLVGNKWKWKYYLASKRKKYFQVSLDLLHGETEYDIRENSSHYKNGATIELAYKMWGMWSYSVELGGVGYRYELEEKDRDVYHFAAECSRGFFDNRFKVNLEYKYQIKDYVSSDRGNVYQNSFLIGGVYEF